MPNVTTAYAKNIIRRALRELVDRSPDKRSLEALWPHFDSSCAYCGVKLVRGKDAHADHLISASARGSNHISNRVLACAKCNEGDKRDLDWEPFLKSKSRSPEEFKQRKARIISWQEKMQPGGRPMIHDFLAKADSMADEVTKLFDEKAAAIREEIKTHR